ncbi:MAG: retropepsin-like aspartic protease family protein [Gammaproteobacteria bacterium]
MRNELAVIILCAAALTAPQAFAVKDLQVVGLFKNKAVLVIDGKRRVVATGQTTPEGVKVVSANSERAVLEVDGKQATYVLGGRTSTAFAKRDSQEVTIYKTGLGLFTAIGAINGLPVDFLIDTGASAVAMNERQASRVGVNYKLDGTPITVETASGSSRAYQVRLKVVKLGEITQRNVEAYVLVGGEEPKTVLLGMSFLGSLEIRNDGRVMHLQTKY